MKLTSGRTEERGGGESVSGAQAGVGDERRGRTS